MSRLNLILLVVILTMAALFFSGFALSYPENVRLGYAACTSCHVSPSGGGILTEYGRMTQSEFMSTWTPTKGFESPTFGVLPDQNVVMIGGDTRYLFRTIDSDFRRVFMQADFEVGINFSEQIAAVKSFGLYNIPTDYSRPIPPIQSLRQYLLLKPSKYMSVRLGEFVPAYGIMVPDHTANIRNGINSPARAGELSLVSEYGELITTSERTARLSWFAGSASVLGASYRPDRYGVFLISGIPWGFVFLEQLDVVGKQKVHYSKVGYQAAKGVLIFSGLADHAWFSELQFLPVAHVELLATARDNDFRFLVHWNW